MLIMKRNCKAGKAGEMSESVTFDYLPKQRKL